MVAQRAAAGLCLDPALRARRSGRAGHLYNGYRITTVCTIDARRGQERFSLLVAGWNAPAANHPRRPQHAAKLEFQIAFSWFHIQATASYTRIALGRT